MSELLGAATPATLEIDLGGKIVPAVATVQVDTRAQATSDELQLIGVDNHPEGRFLLLRALDPGRVVTVVHDTLGAAEGISLLDGQDLVLDSLAKWLLLRQAGGRWTEVLRAPACGLDFDNAPLRRVGSINGGPAAGFRNLLINPNGLVNQRGYVNGAPTTANGEFTLDRWSLNMGGQALSVVDVENTRIFTAPPSGALQRIDGTDIRTGTYVVSYSGDATCLINGVPRPSGSTVQLTGGSNAVVSFINGTFSLPQLEPGDWPTPFERRPYAVELQLCRRFYERWDSSSILFRSETVGNSYGPLFYGTPKRALPTVSADFGLTNATGAQFFNVGHAVCELFFVASQAGGQSFVSVSNFEADAEL